MNRIFSICIAIVFWMLSTQSCEEEVSSRDYPRVTTESIGNDRAVGAVFNGSIAPESIESVEEHGFVWTTRPYMSINDDYSFVIKLGKPTTANFSATIRSQLIAGTKYNVRAFARAGSIVSYGPVVSFISLGSEGPSLQSISPAVARINDTIRIAGKYFSERATDNHVYFSNIGQFNVSNIQATVVNATTTELVVIVPVMYARRPEVTVVLTGNSPVSRADLLTLNVPGMTEVVPGGLCDPIVIRGADFLMFQREVYVNSIKVTPLQVTSEEIIVPRANGVTNPLKIQIQWSQGTTSLFFEEKEFSDVVQYSDQVTAVSQAVVVAGDILRVTGVNLTTCAEIGVGGPKDSNIHFEVLSRSSSEITARIPDGICYADPMSISLTLNSEVFYTSTVKLEIVPFRVDQVTPTTARYEQEIIINGFGLTLASVYFRSPGSARYAVERVSTSNERIVLKQIGPLPEWLGQPMTLLVQKCSEVYDHKTPFVFDTLPVIDDIQPGTVTSIGTDIVISGKGFSSFPEYISVRLEGGTNFSDIPLKEVGTDRLVLDPNSLAERNVPNGTYQLIVRSRGTNSQGTTSLVVALP